MQHRNLSGVSEKYGDPLERSRRFTEHMAAGNPQNDGQGRIAGLRGIARKAASWEKLFQIELSK